MASFQLFFAYPRYCARHDLLIPYYLFHSCIYLDRRMVAEQPCSTPASKLALRQLEDLYRAVVLTLVEELQSHVVSP